MIVVTGADGFLGHFVISRLKEKKIPYLRAVREHRSTKNQWMDDETCTFRLEDALSIENMMKAAKGIIHLASTLSTDFKSAVDCDVKGMEKIVNCWTRGDFIFASSMDVYAISNNLCLKEEMSLQPSTYYGLGKLICEKILQMKYEQCHQAADITYKVLRLPFIIGNHERFPGSLFGRMIQTAVADRDFHLPDDVSGASWICAEELSDFIADIYGSPFSGVYNLASGWVHWKEAAEEIIKTTHSKSKIIIEKEGNRPAGKKGRWLDTGKARQHFGFLPKRTFPEVIETMVRVCSGIKNGK